MKTLETTLLVIVKDEKILLAQKKRGFGTGMFNGVGGKKQEGETIYEAMIRESFEEINVKPINAKLVGKLEFSLYLHEEETTEIMYIYLANDFEGELQESDEMRPKWFDLDKIPYESMFADDTIWLPKVLKGNLVSGRVVFDKDLNMTSQTIGVVDELS